MDAQNDTEGQDDGCEPEKLDISARNLSPKDRLQFAKWVLKGIFTIFILSVGIWLYRQPYGELLIEICRTGLLPIASFVIGDYFGSRGR